MTKNKILAILKKIDNPKINKVQITIDYAYHLRNNFKYLYLIKINYSREIKNS